MLFPIGNDAPRYRVTFVTLVLIAANVAVFGYGLSLDDPAYERFLMDYASLDGSFNPMRSITAAFLHADVLHLAGNMWFLYLFGGAVEGKLGHLRMAGVYLVCCVLSDLAQHIFSPTHFDLVIGASGAVGGLIGALWFLFSRSRIQFFYWIGWFFAGVTWWPMWLAVVYLIGWDALMWYLSSKIGLETGIAHSAHLGGFFCGLACGITLRQLNQVSLDGDDMLTRFVVWWRRGKRRETLRQERNLVGGQANPSLAHLNEPPAPPPEIAPSTAAPPPPPGTPPTTDDYGPHTLPLD